MSTIKKEELRFILEEMIRFLSPSQEIKNYLLNILTNATEEEETT